MHRQSTQRGFILLPVVLAIALIATIAFLLTTESAIDGAMTEDSAAAIEVEQVVRAGLAHATWGAQNSGCAGDMTMTTVPFGQAGSDNYTATVTTPGGGTTAYPNLVSDQDAWFRSDNVTNNNGTNTTYHLRRESGNLEYAIVRFDLASLPAGAQINSAVARFYVDGGKGHPEGPVTVHRVTADWTETDATWETLGDQYDSSVLHTIPAQPAAGDAWVTVNLTAQVQAWVNGELNYGIMLIPTGEGTHAEYISREGTASEQPRLDVIVGTGPATPATIRVTGTLTGNPSPTNDITRTLTRTAVPAYQPPGNVFLQLGTDPGEDGMPDSFYDVRNYGGANYLQVHDSGTWQQYPLIRFDLGRLPRDAAVRSAQLELRLLSLNAPGTATIHQVTHSWVEGTKSGTGTADGATWFTHDGTDAWTSAGGDINAPAVAETAIDGSETWVIWEIAPLVERWLAGEPNYGLQIRPDNGLEQANFASKEDATVGVQPKLTITYACECGSPCLAPQGSGTVLMVVVNPTTLVPADADKKALFESWGYTVTVISESANQTAYDFDIANSDVVYISESVNSTQVGSKVAGAPIGVVSEDGDYNSDLGLATGSGYAMGSAIEVTDASHYITAPFPAGPLDLYSAAMEGLTVAGTEAPGLQTLADWGTAGSLVVLDEGVTTTGGGTAAGRRVMLPLGRVANFNWDYLNANGRLILHRALQWGMGNDTGATPKNLLLVVADAATPSTRSAGRKTLMESWGYTVTLIDDGDSQANFDTAMAANDVVYVTDTVSGPTLLDKVTNTTSPVVNEKGSKLGNFGFSSSESGTVNASGFTSTDAAHYITEPFSGNPVTVFTSSLSMGVPGGTLAPDLQNVGEVSGTPALATLEDGAALWNGGSAPARRVHLPLGAAETTQLTADGEALMRRAIEWVEGADAATTGPLAHWKLDETTGPTAVDSVGGHDGTWTNGPTWGAGQVGGALSFDGSNDYVDVPYDAALSLTQEMTFTSWIKATSFGSGYQAIISTDVPGNGASNYWFGTRLGELVFGFWADSAFRTVQSTGLNLLPDTWYHLAASFDNATDQVLLYLDGAQVQAGSITFEPTPETANIWIGRSVDGEYWPGKLDEVRIYDQVLDATDIADLAAESVNTELNLLLAVGDATTLASKDAGRKTLMESWGYTVNVIDDGESQAAFDTAVAANDVVFVTSSVGGGTLADKLTGAAIPIVNEFPGKLDNFGFSSVTTDTFSADSFSKSDGSHYISSPYGGGSISLLTSFMTMPKPSGTLAPDLQVVAELATSEFGLVALDAGGTRWDGNPAAARRVFLPYGDALTSQITTEGQDLMKRSIEWALGGGGGGGGGGSPPGNVVYEGFAEVNPSTTYNVDVPTPAGTVAGDLLIAAIASDEDASDLTAPAGWNTIAVVKNGTRVTLGVWWKIAGASEPATRQFTSSSYNMKYGWMMRFTGHDPANPINATSTFDTGSSRDPAVASATTTVDNTLVLRVGGFDHEDITVDDSGLTGHTTITMDLGGSGLGACAGGAGYTTLPTAGATGTSAFALTGREEYVTGTIAIAPAP